LPKLKVIQTHLLGFILSKQMGLWRKLQNNPPDQEVRGIICAFDWGTKIRLCILIFAKNIVADSSYTSQERFELPTDALEGRCSIQLSYWDMAFFNERQF
jgi:hypothetical protein